MKSEMQSPTAQPGPQSDIQNSRPGCGAAEWPGASPGRRPTAAGLWNSLVLVGALGCGLSWAQTNAVPVQRSNRFLLIMETSRAMQPRAEGALKTVEDLLKSDMNRQLRPGDTLGVWTFDEQLHAGRFPLQYWSSPAKGAIASRVMRFVRGQKYEKTARLEKVMPALASLVRSSEFITIILVSSGEAKVEGSSFDQAINETYARWRVQQQKSQMPFVTVLRGKQGKITEYSVNAAPWPVQLPPLPAELRPSEIAQTKTAPQKAPAKPTPVVPSLIVRGKRPDPAQGQAALETAGSGSPGAASTTLSTLTTTSMSSSNALGGGTAPNVPPPQTETAASAQPVSAPNTSGAEPVPTRDSARNLVADDVKQPNHTVSQVAPRPPPATSGLASPPRSLLRNYLWFAAVLVVAVALGFLFFRARRARPVASASLITRSLERGGRA